MEAWKLTFVATDNRGSRKAVINKTWAATCWDAMAKAEKYLSSVGYTDIKFIKCKILNPFQAHFK